MIFKIALKQLKTNLYSNILIIIQLSVVFALIVAMISAVASRSQYYTPFKKHLDITGVICEITGGIEEHFYSTLKKVDNVVFTYAGYIEDESDDFQIIGYNNDIYENFTPTLSSGEWLTTNNKSEFLQAVISENDFDIKTGDIILIGDIKIEIIGVVADNSYVFGYMGNHDINMDYRDLYAIYNHNYYNGEEKEKPLIFFRHNDMKKYNMDTWTYGTAIITYEDDITKEEISFNRNSFMKLGTTRSASTEIITENSKKYIYQELYLLVPIMLCVLIITLNSTISINAVSTKRQLKNYSIYYICGSLWKQCGLINLISSLIICLLSSVLAALGLLVLKYTGVLSQTVVGFGIWQAIACASVIIIYLTLSLLLPLRIIGKTSPKTVLYRN